MEPQAGDADLDCGWCPHSATEVAAPHGAAFGGREHQSFGAGLCIAVELSVQGAGDEGGDADGAAPGCGLGLAVAQGITVDRAVLVADEHTTAEALYVGMTRGRHTNTALVVTDGLDLEHASAPATPRVVLEGALARVSAEMSATETL